MKEFKLQYYLSGNDTIFINDIPYVAKPSLTLIIAALKVAQSRILELDALSSSRSYYSLNEIKNALEFCEKI